MGDVEEQNAEELLNKYLKSIPASQNIASKIIEPSDLSNIYVEHIKEDAQQA